MNWNRPINTMVVEALSLYFQNQQNYVYSQSVGYTLEIPQSQYISHHHVSKHISFVKIKPNVLV